MADVAALAAPTSAGRLCMSPSTTTPASPSPNCCPISRLSLPSTSYARLWLSMPSMVSTSAPCSPTTARPIAPASFARPVSSLASATTSPVPTLRAPTAKPNALSRPLYANGLTFAIGPTPSNATNTSSPGCTTTTSPDPMVVSITLRLSAEPILPVQRLDSPQQPATMMKPGVIGSRATDPKKFTNQSDEHSYAPIEKSISDKANRHHCANAVDEGHIH